MKHALLAALVVANSALAAPPDDLKAEARQTLVRSTTYFRTKVATHGGYVYVVSADLKDRWGEGKADVNTIFVERPGTPIVGGAYLAAYTATGDTAYLDAARETAAALI